MVIVFGKNGQLGSELSSRLGQYGCSIESAQLDFQDIFKSVAGRLDGLVSEGKKIHGIINAMAYTAVDQAESDKENAFIVNAELPKAIALWASEKKVPFVHVSTDYVYGRDDDQWISENSEYNPTCVYGKTKLAGDDAVLSTARSSVVLRTSWVWSGDAKFKNFSNTMMRVMKSKVDAGDTSPLKVVNDQWGRPTEASELAQACLRALAWIKEKSSSKNSGMPESAVERTFHVTSVGEPITWYHWARGIQKKLSETDPRILNFEVLPIKSEDYSTPARRPKNSRLSLQKSLKAGFVDQPDKPEPDRQMM